MTEYRIVNPDDYPPPRLLRVADACRMLGVGSKTLGNARQYLLRLVLTGSGTNLYPAEYLRALKERRERTVNSMDQDAWAIAASSKAGPLIAAAKGGFEAALQSVLAMNVSATGHRSVDTRGVSRLLPVSSSTIRSWMVTQLPVPYQDRTISRDLIPEAEFRTLFRWEDPQVTTPPAPPKA